MKRLTRTRTVTPNSHRSHRGREPLGIVSLGEIGALVLLIAVVLSVLAGFGLVDNRPLLQEDSAATNAGSDPAKRPIYGMDVAHTGDFALLHNYRSLELYDLWTGARLESGDPSHFDAQLLSAVAMSEDGRRTAVGRADGSILFHLEEPSGVRQVVATEHARSVDSLEFSPDGLLAASGSNDGTVRIWDVSSGRLRHALQLTGCSRKAQTSVVFSRNGDFVLAASRSGAVASWHTHDGASIARYSIPHGLSELALSPDGESLVVANAYQQDLRGLTARSGQELWRQKHPTPGSMYLSVAISPDGRWVAAGDLFGCVRTFDAATGRPFGSFVAHGAGVSCLQYSPDGRILYSASYDGRVGIWESAAGSLAPKRTG